MDKSFRAANTPVKFSGKVFLLDEAMKQQIPQLGGYEYYAIDLTELKRGLWWNDSFLFFYLSIVQQKVLHKF